MRTLVTGFGPFGTVTENPSAQLAEGSGRDYEVLTVSYDAVDRFIDSLSADRFDTLLLLGVATGRDHITPEIFARNWRGNKADVDGMGIPGPIDEGKPLLIDSTLWNAHLLADLEVSLNLQTSMDAGSYLCNYIYYRALEKFSQRRVGFLHIPPFSKLDQTKQASMLQSILHKIEA